MKTVIEISWTSLWRIFFFILLGAIVYFGRQIFLGLFLALVISSGLESIVDLLERKGLPRPLGVILIFLFGIIFLATFIYTVIPLLIADLNSLFVGENKFGNSWWLPLLDWKAYKSISDFSAQLSRQFFSGDISILGIFSGAVGNLGLVVAVLFCSFYLTLSRDGVEKFIRFVFPIQYEEAALRIYERSRRQTGFWLKTQILLSLTMSVLTWIALTILGVKHALLLGFLAGIFELVPFVGPILAGAIAVLVALLSSPTLAFYTLLVFLVIHQTESHILVPLLTRRNVGLHPVVVIIALLVGIEMNGVLGGVVAVPMAAVLQEIIEDWSRTKNQLRSYQSARLL